MKITELKKKALETCGGNWAILVGATILFLIMSVAMVSSGEIGGVITMFSVFPLIYFVYVKCLMLKRNNKSGIKLRETNITLRITWNYIKYNLWLLLFSLPGILLTSVPAYFMFLKPLVKNEDIITLLTAKTIGIYFIFLLIAIIYTVWIRITYDLTIYLIAENNECNSTLKLMKEARLLMKGNMVKYILLKLSFIGWAILANLTFAIGALWLFPYVELTKIEFYYNLKENNI